MICQIKTPPTFVGGAIGKQLGVRHCWQLRPRFPKNMETICRSSFQTNISSSPRNLHSEFSFGMKAGNSHVFVISDMRYAVSKILRTDVLSSFYGQRRPRPQRNSRPNFRPGGQVRHTCIRFCKRPWSRPTIWKRQTSETSVRENQLTNRPP